MGVFWFVAGMLTTVAVLLVLLPWLRTVPGLGTLPAFPWQAPAIALVMAGAAAAFYHLWGSPDLLAQAPALASAEPTARGASSATPGADRSAAGSMSAAVSSLRARLEKGGGSAGDWDLLAKSYEFMGAGRCCQSGACPPVARGHGVHHPSCGCRRAAGGHDGRRSEAFGPVADPACAGDARTRRQALRRCAKNLQATGRGQADERRYLGRLRGYHRYIAGR